MKPTFVLNGGFPLVNLEELDAIPGVRTLAVRVTPAIARRLLERNVHNRKISEKVIQKYIAEIKAGEWRLTPAASALMITALWWTDSTGCMPSPAAVWRCHC